MSQPLKDQVEKSLAQAKQALKTDLEETKGGLYRTLLRLQSNQRLSGPDYGRLTAAAIYALSTLKLEDIEIEELNERFEGEGFEPEGSDD